MTEQAHIDALKREQSGPLSAWGTAERVLTWRYLRPHWRRLTGVMAMAFASSGLELIRMGLLLAFLGAAPTWILKGLPIASVRGLPVVSFNWLLLAVVFASIVAVGLDWWRRHVANVVQRDFTESLRADVCLAMLHRPLDWFTANPAGQASYLLNGQVGRFSALVPMASDGVASILQGAAVIGLMVWSSVPLTIVALMGSLALWVWLYPLQRRIRSLSVEVSVDSGKAAAKAEECAYAIKLIKSCRTEAFERDRYATLARGLAEKQVQLSDLRNAAGGITLIGFVGILAASVWAAPNGTVLAGFGALLVDLGKTLIAYGVVMTRPRAALLNIFTSGPAALAAGAALVALGSTFTSIASGAGRGTAQAGAFREPRQDHFTTRVLTLGPSKSVSAVPAMHFTVIGANDPAFRDADLEHIARQIREARLGFAHRLTIDVPGRRPDRGVDLGQEAGSNHRVAEPVPARWLAQIFYSFYRVGLAPVGRFHGRVSFFAPGYAGPVVKLFSSGWSHRLQARLSVPPGKSRDDVPGPVQYRALRVVAAEYRLPGGGVVIPGLGQR